MKTMNQNLEVKSWGSEGVFEGYASVFNKKDHHKDVVVKGAFQKSLEKWKSKKDWPKMLWQHDVSKPIGVWEEITEDEKGLYVKGRFLLQVQQGREAYELLKSGVVKEMSIGFHSNKSRYDVLKDVTYLEGIDLQEISLVTYAANPEAKVTDFKDENFFVKEVNKFVNTVKEMNKVITQYYKNLRS